MNYPSATQRPVPSHGGPMGAHLGLVLHVQEGNNSPFGEFNNKKNEASSHFWVSKGGHVEQYVDAGQVAWAQMSGNTTYNSVETEGFTTEALTDAQIDALARLYAWGAGVYGWPVLLADTPGQHGLGWHGMGGNAWGHPHCPGDTRKSQRIDILARVSELTSPPAPPMQITTASLGDTVKQTTFANVKLGPDGNGWEWCDFDNDKIIGVTQQGGYPPKDGYWNLCKFGHQARAQDNHKSVIEIQGGTPNQVITFHVTATE